MGTDYTPTFLGALAVLDASVITAMWMSSGAPLTTEDTVLCIISHMTLVALLCMWGYTSYVNKRYP